MGRPAARHQLPKGVQLTVMLFFEVEVFYILHVFLYVGSLTALMFAGFRCAACGLQPEEKKTLAEAWNLQAAACFEAGTNMLSARSGCAVAGGTLPTLWPPAAPGRKSPEVKG